MYKDEKAYDEDGMRDVNQVGAIYKIEIWMREAIHLRKL
jgi:hypothetical protein